MDTKDSKPKWYPFVASIDISFISACNLLRCKIACLLASEGSLNSFDILSAKGPCGEFPNLVL